MKRTRKRWPMSSSPCAKELRVLATFSSARGLIKRGIGDVLELTDERLPTSPKRFVILGAQNRAETSGSEDQIVWRCFG